MFGRESSLFLLLFGTVILGTVAFSLFPTRLESGEVYSYTDEKGVVVITNTPLPDNIKNRAAKIGSYKDITDEDRKRWKKEKEEGMQAWRDEQVRQDQTARKRVETVEKAREEAEIPEKLRKMEAQTAEAAKSAKDARDRAVEVLKILPSGKP
jgi:acyl-CoA synthetase (AMP-forming)/AMP-acid ligase II